MSFSKKITITWWPADDREGEVPDEYKDALEESGFARAIEMMSKGFSSGELNDNVYLSLDGESEDGVDFRGWWSVNRGNELPDEEEAPE